MTNQPNDQPSTTPERLPGPVYRNLGEAADDPNLDMGKPFFVAPDPVDRGDFGHPLDERIQYPPMYPQQQVAAKNPGLALVASFFIPGLGSLLNGSIGVGILIFSAYVLSWLLLFVVVGFITLPAVWIWGMYDGYHGAKKWNAQHGIVS